MQIENLKRGREEDQTPIIQKRNQKQESVTQNIMIDLYSFENNLERLKFNFDKIDEQMIKVILEQSQNNLEKATQKLRTFQELFLVQQKFSVSLCESLKQINQIEEAQQMIFDSFAYFTQLVQGFQKNQQEKQENCLQKLKQDNEILKKGIRAMVSQSEINNKYQQIQTENNNLRDQIKNLKLEALALRIQLQ